VCRRAGALGWTLVGHRVDVRDRAAVGALMAEVRPTAVIHTAYRVGDWATTAGGAANVALAAAAQRARLVHLSSDAVFAGRPEPYTEDDPPSPVHAYGASKAAAETAVAAVAPGAAIVRTSLIVGPGSPHERPGAGAGVFFTDEIRCPVHVGDLAAAVLELAVGDHAGVLHVAGPTAVDRYRLAVLVARHHGRDATRVPAGTIAASGLVRPGEVRLDSSRAAGLLVVRVRGVDEIYAQSI